MGKLDIIGICRHSVTFHLLATSQGLHLTRMNVPYLLGTIITPERERARLYGFFGHLINGWIFSLLYVYIFEARHMVNWWFGLLRDSRMP